jgi:DNA-binding NarL/FixJ family response regulator
MSGIDGIRVIRDQHPHMLLLMLTVYGDDERIFEALRNAARCYFTGTRCASSATNP